MKFLEVAQALLPALIFIGVIAVFTAVVTTNRDLRIRLQKAEEDIQALKQEKDPEAFRPSYTLGNGIPRVDLSQVGLNNVENTADTSQQVGFTQDGVKVVRTEDGVYTLPGINPKQKEISFDDVMTNVRARAESSPAIFPDLGNEGLPASPRSTFEQAPVVSDHTDDTEPEGTVEDHSDTELMTSSTALAQLELLNLLDAPITARGKPLTTSPLFEELLAKNPGVKLS